VEQAIFNEEVVRAKTPSVANVLGLAMGGPTVIAHGTEEQKKRYLPAILSAEEIWCQGFSEPESGSDLASVKTRAVRDGDEWVVTGQKVWTTFAHHAKWCMLVARTDPDAPKHKGLTYFLMDMDQEAVQVRPLRQITGEAEFNELFIEEARIPHANIVGGESNGWAVAITTLMHERATLAFGLQVAVQITLAELVEHARATRAGNGLLASEDPVIRQRLAQLMIEAEVLRLNAFRMLSGIMRTGVPGPEGSLGKWHWSEVNQSLTELAIDIAGPRAMLDEDNWTYRFLRARANSIEGGTTEILKNIVAERVLGLPRMR
jgi:alkylation response protein AidB-like acyl-CoA dehydrogenase